MGGGDPIALGAFRLKSPNPADPELLVRTVLGSV